jgi:peptidoglycan/LPS O-acetylase OafA/YrhL
MSMRATDPRDDRLGYVDGLRALAVLGVVFSHAGKYTLDLHPAAPLYHALAEGAHGVDLFFVISGLCLAYPTLARLRSTGRAEFDVVRYAAHRVVRIIPPYWGAFGLVLLVALGMLALGYSLPWPTIMMPTTGYGLRQLFFLDRGYNLVGSFWTLAVEFRWYFLFPLLMLLWTRSRVAFTLVGLASLCVYHFTSVHIIDFATLPGFMLGIVAADLTIRGSRLNAWAPLLFVAAVIASLLLEPGHLKFAVQDQIWWQVACFFLVLTGCTNQAFKKILSLRAMAAIGVASYSIYLVHDPPMAWYGLYGGHNLFAAITLGLLLGFAFYLVWERWFITQPWKQRLVNAVQAPLAWLVKPRGHIGLIELVRPLGTKS